MEAMAFAAVRSPDREASLRTALREYLAALDRGHLLEAELIERCGLGPRTGPVTLLLPIVSMPVRGRLLSPDRP